ncbi:MAG: LysR family transcriptional regulator [Clostridia bacterium]|nr:LysR family transcriptional regulator [Clostridia bacterium]
MEIRCLNTFIQVAERGSFTRAAEALNYTQSTVSSQIKHLETELNTQLFERINHTVTLTDTGRALLVRAHQILTLVDEVRTASGDESVSNEPVRFAMAPSVCSVMMGKTYLTFHKMFPHVLVKILEADTERMLEMLNQNDVDLVFLVDRREFHSDYIVASEKKEAVHFVVRHDSELCSKKNLRIEDLLQYPFFLSEKGISYRRIFDERLAERNLTVTPMVEMGNAQLLLELVELGGGISLLPDYVTRKSHREGKIRYLDVEQFEIEIWRQLIYHKNKWVSPAMRKVIDYCSEVSENQL